MKLNIGSFTAGPQLIFRGIVNWLVGLDRGRLLASQDGIRFFRIPNNIFGLTKSNINIIEHLEDEFWVGGDQGKVAKSTNGIDWTTIITGFNTNIISINYKKKEEIASTSWTTSFIDNVGLWTTNYINYMVYGNNRWLAIPNGTGTMISDNLITWKPGYQIIGSNSGFNNVAYVNNAFHATSTTITGGTFQSTDAVFWTTQTTLFKYGVGLLTYGNNIWVQPLSSATSTTPSVVTSTNGINWVTRTSTLYLTTSFVYGNGIWLGGSSSNIRRSTDTILWTSVNTAYTWVTASINSLAYGNGIFIAHSPASTGVPRLRTSTDGITWTTIINSRHFTLLNRSLLYGNGMWFGISSDQGSVVKSTNSVNWESIPINSFDSTLIANTITHNNGIWVFGTNKNYILITTGSLPEKSYLVGIE